MEYLKEQISGLRFSTRPKDATILASSPTYVLALFKSSVVVPVRSISNSNTEKDLYQMRKLCHENLLTVHEIFDFDSSFYIVSERMHITLDHPGTIS
jgi:hypothetical protein